MDQNPGSQPTREPSSLGVTGGNGGNPLKKNISSNPGYKRYYVSTKNSFYRWELLYIHKGIVDKKIPNIKLGNSNIISYIPDKKNSKKKEKKEVQKFS